ncbi:MAG TPA: histidine phosphatase family protein [Spirochaetota bacterium]|nr:histidine phosphatase family protein [Spirochaetota bacterium]HOL56206.1 histidine phosphatase family protein [Spirochaetota bacterium]HPP03823.1 histidine phosphatase family protein [Spirochaetota bacterium]
MKEILLLRHAKSSWEDLNIEDFDRPLKKRGINDTIIMAEYIKQSDLIPEYIICSDARRTRETLSILLEKINSKIETLYTRKIYEADVSDILEVIYETDNKFNRIMIVGHNPGMEETVVALTKKSFPFPKFSTCGLAYLKLDIDDWKNIKKSKANLELFKNPKMFK